MFQGKFDIRLRDGKNKKFIDPDYQKDMMPLIMQSNWECRELIKIYEERQPHSVLEIGVAHGGTLIEWLKYAADPTRIVGIEYTKLRVDKGEPYWKSFQKRWTELSLFVGRSQNSQIIDEVWDIFKSGGLEWLFIDGAHEYIPAKLDFINYGALVKKGGVIVLHDIYREFEKGNDMTVTELWEEIRHAGYLTRELRSYPEQTNRGIGIVYVE